MTERSGVSNPNRVYNDAICGSMGAAYDQAVLETPHADLFPEIKRSIAEHILRNADQGLSHAAELCASAVTAFTTEAK
jgi:hypothetical protein